MLIVRNLLKEIKNDQEAPGCNSLLSLHPVLSLHLLCFHQSQYFCAGSVCKPKPFRSDNPQLRSRTLYLWQHWGKPTCILRQNTFVSTLSWLLFTRSTLVDPSCQLLPASVVQRFELTMADQQAVNLVWCFVMKGKNRMICVDFWSPCIIIDFKQGRRKIYCICVATSFSDNVCAI